MIVSPVGYGATSLLALVAEASHAPVVWLSGRGQAGTALNPAALAQAGICLTFLSRASFSLSQPDELFQA